jgi:hypothetical protein
MTSPGRDRISQDVTDVSSTVQLLRYATAGLVEYLLRRRGLTQGKIAQGAGLGSSSRTAGPALSVALRSGPTAAQLRGLDEIMGALAPDMGATGGLSSLALRLSAGRRAKIEESALAARVPPSWTKSVLTDPPGGEAGVLVQASALLSEFVAADKMGVTDLISSIRDRYKGEMELLVRRLILISVMPPTSRNYDAQILLGMLASYAFEPMRDRLEAQLRYSPLGFRVWPAVTRLVQLSEGREHADALRVWVRHLILDSEELRQSSLYPASGLDLELAITIPPSWSPPGDDWVADFLRARSLDRAATIDERGTAIMGLWQRAISEGRPSLPEVEEVLRNLIFEFRDPSSRPDASAGLRWLAANLEFAIGNRVPVCNHWPDVDEPWFRHVQEAASELDKFAIPENLLVGTKNLFRHMILQNAGVFRRHAIETVVTSGWSEPVARALGFLLRVERDEPWLRSRVHFALGLLQQPDMGTETDLTRACEYGYNNLHLDKTPDDISPPRSYVSELHASLFAVGDCFGVTGAEDNARSARERLRPILESFANIADSPAAQAQILRQPARAVAYLLTVTAQPRYGSKMDLSQELLEKLAHHSDPVTARLSKWALTFRFAPDGTTRTFLASAEYGEHDDIPY